MRVAYVAILFALFVASATAQPDLESLLASNGVDLGALIGDAQQCAKPEVQAAGNACDSDNPCSPECINYYNLLSKECPKSLTGSSSASIVALCKSGLMNSPTPTNTPGASPGMDDNDYSPPGMDIDIDMSPSPFDDMEMAMGNFNFSSMFPDLPPECSDFLNKNMNQSQICGEKLDNNPNVCPDECKTLYQGMPNNCYDAFNKFSQNLAGSLNITNLPPPSPDSTPLNACDKEFGGGNVPVPATPSTPTPATPTPSTPATTTPPASSAIKSGLAVFSGIVGAMMLFA